MKFIITLKISQGHKNMHYTINFQYLNDILGLRCVNSNIWRFPENRQLQGIFQKQSFSLPSVINVLHFLGITGFSISSFPPATHRLEFKRALFSKLMDRWLIPGNPLQLLSFTFICLPNSRMINCKLGILWDN